MERIRQRSAALSLLSSARTYRGSVRQMEQEVQVPSQSGNLQEDEEGKKHRAVRHCTDLHGPAVRAEQRVTMSDAPEEGSMRAAEECTRQSRSASTR